MDGAPGASRPGSPPPERRRVGLPRGVGLLAGGGRRRPARDRPRPLPVPQPALQPAGPAPPPDLADRLAPDRDADLRPGALVRPERPRGDLPDLPFVVLHDHDGDGVGGRLDRPEVPPVGAELRRHRASRSRSKVLFPAALPQILTGLRLALGISWVVVVAAEMLGVSSGLGFQVNDARNNLRYDLVVAAMVVIGIIGIGLDALMRGLERFELRRRGAGRA